MLYKALRKTLNSKPILLPENEELDLNITDGSFDWYQSLYLYNEEHKARYEKNGTLAGIKDSVTKLLYFDFDSENDVEAALVDSITLLERLDKDGIKEKNLNIFFTGNKGISVEIPLVSAITPSVFKQTVYHYAKDLTTFDKVVNDPNRIVRIANTVHPKSGLFKIPLTIDQLTSLSVEEIKNLAKQPIAFTLAKPILPPNIPLEPEIVKSKQSNNVLEEIDWTKKPEKLTNCRFAMQNGMFDNGNRNNVLLTLAATYKNQGFDLEIAYRMLKGVATLQAKRFNTDRYNDDELYNNIIMQVYSEWWNGGQGSCRSEGWMADYCNALGEHACNKSKSLFEPKTLSDLSGNFKIYTKNIDKNTILTGIPSIDKNVFLSTGVNLGILGAAGSGKSALALEILSNTSKAGVKSVFASLDMHSNRMFEKAMYRVTGLKRDALYKVYQEDNEKEYLEKFNQEFENVFFFNKSAPTVHDIKEYILECEKQSGQKIKLVMLDYFERVSSDFSDDTQASKRVAGELQDLVNELDIALITIVQPNKFGISAGPDTPLYSYANIKGSSFVYQAFRVIISLWRPFYNAKDFSKDKFMQMAILKNDLGELNEFVFKWEGQRGMIKEMYDSEKDDFYYQLDKKNEKKNNGNEGWQ